MSDLRKALEPFAKLLTEYEEDGDTPPIRRGQKHITIPVALADLRRAREAFSGGADDPPLPMPNYEKLLGELLAVIHRDGGHHEAENGTERAVADAINRVHDWLALEDAPSTGDGERVREAVAPPQIKEN